MSELVATVIGGGLAVAGGFLSSQTTAVRERKDRAREERIQAYVDMLSHLESFDEWRRSVAKRLGPLSDDPTSRAFREFSAPAIPPEALSVAEKLRHEVEDELAKLSASWTRVQLVGGTPAVAALRSYLLSVQSIPFMIQLWKTGQEKEPRAPALAVTNLDMGNLSEVARALRDDLDQVWISEVHDRGHRRWWYFWWRRPS